MSLIAEIKRRRVLRVAGAYLLGAWVVLQVADIVFPALGLPAWTLKLIVSAVILGFPLALVVGWVFDITPGGIERTPGGIKLAFPGRAAMLGTIIVAVGVLAFVGFRRYAIASKLDMEAVVILPFRALGDANALVMREGMVDLLSAKLTGAVDSRTTLALWRRTVDSEKDDLAPREALQLARKLGAGNVLLGEVFGTASELTVHVKLYSAVNGALIENIEEKSSHDDVLKLVDRVATRLLSAQAGEGQRTAALLSESLPAVRAYLAGARWYRLGVQDSASAQFNAALAEDSTFALAAAALAHSKAWIGWGPDYVRGLRLVWQYRDRLPRRDRDYLDAWLGKDHPARRAHSEVIEAFETLTIAYPDMVEAWYQLGDALFHFGARADIEKPLDKAMAAWARVLALDSTYAPALEHQIAVFAAREDTASLRRVARLLYDRNPEVRVTTGGALVAAQALHDEKWLAELLENLAAFAEAEVGKAVEYSIAARIPQDHVDTLLARLDRSGSAGAQTTAYVSMVQIQRGRPAAAAQSIRSSKEAVWLSPVILFVAASNLDADRETAERAAHDLAGALGASAKTMAEAANLCALEQWRVQNGDLSTVAQSLVKLRAFAAENPARSSSVGSCSYALDVMVHSANGSPQLRTAVQAADSVVLNGALQNVWYERLLLVTVQGYQRLEDRQNALKVARRAGPETSMNFASVILERARLAGQLGQREEAIESYQRYLKLRSRAEPGSTSEKLVQRARDELAALVAERS
jgi:tetratricopeptide (TPR) repeat protein